MTGLQIAMAAGVMIALGVLLAVSWCLPTTPDARESVARLTQRTRATAPEREHVPGEAKVQVGAWILRHGPERWRLGLPRRDLAVMRMTPAQWYGEKAIFGLVGLVIPGPLAALCALLGMPLPWGVPVGGTLALALGMFFLPDYNLRDDAKKARAEANRALAAYVDLVAVCRLAGADARQALSDAASVGDSWIFQRLREELARTSWSGESAWDGLHALADEIGLSELDDIADIIRLSGEESAQVYETLRAHARSVRAAMLAQEISLANAVSERMTIPMAFTGIVFMLILVAPMLLRIIAGT